MTDIFELFKRIQSKQTDTQPVSFIIAGLGNPDKEYEGTRHNIGFMAVDYYLAKTGTKCNRLKFKSLIGDISIAGKRGIIMKPQTYMNNSGEAIRDAAEFYKIAPENIIVMVDDINLAPGHLRIRKSGSAGGHNGLKSIIYQLNSDAFPRIRIGVGEKPEGWELVNWVLGKIPKEDEKALFECLTWIPDICEHIVNGKTDDAMCAYNGKSALTEGE